MGEIEVCQVQDEALLIVISGPSGVGKDSVIQRMKDRKLPFHFVVTATNRLPRPNEVNGVDYLFYSSAEFEKMIENNELLEHAIVYGEYKGIPKSQVRDSLASGKDVVMRLDVQGAATIRQLCPEALMIFLTIRDEDEMVRRLQSRRTESPESLKLRIETARHEMTQLDTFDYVIINREGYLDETVDVIVAIIVAEHHRVNPRKVTL